MADLFERIARNKIVTKAIKDGDILNAANAHYTKSGPQIYNFNKRDLISLVREMVAQALEAPQPLTRKPIHESARNRSNRSPRKQRNGAAQEPARNLEHPY